MSKSQLVRIEHQTVIATQIQTEIDAYDAYHQPLANDNDIPEDLEDLDLTKNMHITVGSKLKAVTYAELAGVDSSLFARFHIRVSEFLSNLLPTSGIELPDGKRIMYTVNDTVSY